MFLVGIEAWLTAMVCEVVVTPNPSLVIPRQRRPNRKDKLLRLLGGAKDTA